MTPKFKTGDLVAIPFRHMGGEIVRVHPDNYNYDVRLTSFNPLTFTVDDHIEIFGEAELRPLPKQKGVIIL